MKRKLSLLLAALMVTMIPLAGCSQSPAGQPTPQQPVTVTLWHYYNGAQKMALDQLILDFNESVGLEKGIVVEAVNKGNPNQLAQSVFDSVDNKVGAEPVPNMFLGYADAVYRLDQQERVVDLDKYLTKEEQSEYLPGYIEEGRMGADNSLKIFPTAKSTELMMINKTDWDKFANATGANAEDLKTIEGVTRLSKSYYEWTDGLTPNDPDDGKAFFGRDAVANYFIIGGMQMDNEFFHVLDGKVTFNTDEAVMRRLWDNYYVPMVNGWYCAKGRYRSDDAKVGELVALVGSTSSALYFPTEVSVGEEEPYPIEVWTMSAPIFEGGKPYAVQQGAGIAVLSSTSEEEYASVEFLKWFTEGERNLRFGIESGYLPVRKDGNELPKLEAAIAEAKESGNPYSPVLESTLRTAYETIGASELYTNRAFPNGTEARNVLEQLMVDYINRDLPEIEAKVAEGMSRADAAALYTTDEHFEEWLTELRAQLQATQEG